MDVVTAAAKLQHGQVSTKGKAMGRIGAGVDGSVGSLTAVRWAAYEGGVQVVGSVSPRPCLPPDSPNQAGWE